MSNIHYKIKNISKYLSPSTLKLKKEVDYKRSRLKSIFNKSKLSTLITFNQETRLDEKKIGGKGFRQSLNMEVTYTMKHLEDMGLAISDKQFQKMINGIVKRKLLEAKNKIVTYETSGRIQSQPIRSNWYKRYKDLVGMEIIHDSEGLMVEMNERWNLKMAKPTHEQYKSYYERTNGRSLKVDAIEADTATAARKVIRKSKQ